MIYAAKRCCLILKAFGTVQHSIFCYNYIQSNSLNVLYAIYMSQERSDQSCQCSMIFEEGRAKPLDFQSPLTKCVGTYHDATKTRTCVGHLLGMHDWTSNTVMSPTPRYPCILAF